MSIRNSNLAVKKQPIDIVLFKQVFRGREDVVPELWEHSGRKGYMPICRNKLKLDKCKKVKKIKSPCKNCNYKEYVSLNDELLQKHLDGKTTLGIYPLLPDNTCYFIAGDFDNHNGYKSPWLMSRRIMRPVKPIRYPVM